SFLNRRDWLLIIAYAFKPIKMMVITNDEMEFVWTDLGFNDLWIARIQGLRTVSIDRITCSSLIVATGHKYPPIASLELNTIGKLVAYNHLHAVVIECFGFKNSMDIPKTFLRKFGMSPNFHRT